MEQKSEALESEGDLSVFKRYSFKINSPILDPWKVFPKLHQFGQNAGTHHIDHFSIFMAIGVRPCMLKFNETSIMMLLKCKS